MSQQQFQKSWQKDKPGHLNRHQSARSSFGHLMSKSTWHRLLKRAMVTGIFLILFGSLAAVAALGIFSRQLPDIHSLLNRYVAESTKIYDRTGEILLYEVHGDEKRTVVELDNISPFVKQALISAEDKNFYKHGGFSIIGIIRSVVRNIFTGSTVGGSTLTQQMIKNTVLTNEKTYTRKIKELILSREAEKTFTKDEILKIYLNTINYGGVNYGVESASQDFFGKSSKDVTIAEAAILAAVPQAPTRLSPYGRNIELLMDRKNWVIDKMEEQGYITKDQAKTAKEQELNFKKEQISNIKAPHFVFYVREQLAEQFGEEAVSQGGMKVITTLDWDKQQEAEKAVEEANEFNLTKGANDAALVSLDAKTGEILAMVGSQDYFNDEIAGKVNVAIEKRQPGSSIKPVVYAAALEKGFTPDTVVYDVNTNFAVSGKPYTPKDYDLRERGPITMRYALQGSLNIPAVKFMYLAGVDNVMKKLAEDLEYSTITKETDCGLSLVLGGCEVTLLDHAGAYTAFARDGEMAKPAGILNIEDKDGKELFKFSQKNKKVWAEQTVRQLNSILTDNAARTYVFGSSSPLQLGTRPVAAKTGTTNDFNDGWTIGYTPSFVTGVWVGNADGTDMKNGADGSIVAAPIWNAYMKKILENTPVEYFKTPDPLPENLQPALRGQVSGGVELEIDRISGKLATAYTPVHLREKRQYRQDHTILYYVDKNNPQGPAPTDPNNDPAFSVWEAAVKDWAERQSALPEGTKNPNPLLNQGGSGIVTSEMPPTEYDDIHLPEFTPTLSFITPTANQIIESPVFMVEVSASAPKGIYRYEYYLDDALVTTGSSNQVNINAGAYAGGFHSLKAVAYDLVDNYKEESIDLNFKFASTAPTITWQAPENNKEVTGADYPIQIDFKFDRPGTGVNVYYAPSSNLTAQTLIVSPLGHEGREFSVFWKTPPAPSQYKIFVEVDDGLGGKVRLPSMVTVNMK